MTLLEFARGPAMEWSLIILVAGVVLRFAGIFLLTRHKTYFRTKGGSTLAAGLPAVDDAEITPEERPSEASSQPAPVTDGDEPPEGDDPADPAAADSEGRAEAE